MKPYSEMISLSLFWKWFNSVLLRNKVIDSDYAVKFTCPVAVVDK